MKQSQAITIKFGRAENDNFCKSCSTVEKNEEICSFAHRRGYVGRPIIGHQLCLFNKLWLSPLDYHALHQIDSIDIEAITGYHDQVWPSRKGSFIQKLLNGKETQTVAQGQP